MDAADGRTPREETHGEKPHTRSNRFARVGGLVATRLGMEGRTAARLERSLLRRLPDRRGEVERESPGLGDTCGGKSQQNMSC